MRTMTGGVSFFELGAPDTDKTRVFYEGVFGWQFETGPSGAGWVISTGGAPGGVHPDQPGTAPYVFFAVDDIDAAKARVVDLGGEIVPMDVGGDDPESIAKFGRFAFCTDDQGTPFGLHEPPAGG